MLTSVRVIAMPLRSFADCQSDVTLYYDGSSPAGIQALLTIAGYHGDLNETFPVGTISDDSAKLIRTTRQCLDEAIKICKPGALFSDLGKVMCAYFIAFVAV